MWHDWQYNNLTDSFTDEPLSKALYARFLGPGVSPHDRSRIPSDGQSQRPEPQFTGGCAMTVEATPLWVSFKASLRAKLLRVLE